MIIKIPEEIEIEEEDIIALLRKEGYEVSLELYEYTIPIYHNKTTKASLIMFVVRDKDGNLVFTPSNMSRTSWLNSAAQNVLKNKFRNFLLS